MKLVYSTEAQEQLQGLYEYLALEASLAMADRQISRIIERCEGLLSFPYKGVSRAEISPGLRMIIEGRVVILYEVLDGMLRIAGIYQGGRDYASGFQEDDADFLSPDLAST